MWASLSRLLLFDVRFGFRQVSRFKRFEFFPGEAVWETPVGVTGDIGETLILVEAEARSRAVCLSMRLRLLGHGT